MSSYQILDCFSFHFYKLLFIFMKFEHVKRPSSSTIPGQSEGGGTARTAYTLPCARWAGGAGCVGGVVSVSVVSVSVVSVPGGWFVCGLEESLRML